MLSSPKQCIYPMKSVNKFFHDKNSSFDVHVTLPLYVKLIQSNVKQLRYKVNSSSQMWVGPATKWTHPVKCEEVPLQKWILSHQMWVCSANKWNLQSGFYVALRVFISGTLRWKILKWWLGKLHNHECRWQARWQPADSQRTWPAVN